MKTTKLLFAAAVLLAAAGSLRAETLNLNFDGTNAPGLTGEVSFRETLAARLTAVTDGAVRPESGWGNIPPVDGISCVDSPYGCPGQGGNIGGGQEPTPPSYYSGLLGVFPAAVSVNTGSNSSAPMLMTGGQAATKLGSAVINKIYVRDITETLKLKFPYQMSRAEAIKAMAELELETIKLVKAQLSKDLQKILPMPWESAAEQQRKLAIIRSDEGAINIWWGAARTEAMGGGNWTENNQMTFTFNGGPAYLQIGKALQCRDCFRSRP